MASNLKRVGEYIFPPRSLRLRRPKNIQGKSIKASVEEMMGLYPHAKAFMAAPMFGHTGTGPCAPGGFTPCTRQLDTVSGVDYKGCRPKSGLTFSVLQGKVGVHPQDLVSPNAALGLQLYPTLVWAGTNKGKTEKPSSVAGLGIHGVTGEFIYLVGAGGSLKDLGNLFIEKGCNYAGYCDAGSSAALYVVGEGWRGVHARAPKLPCWLVV